jgi:glycosyltransferase involved in cell wall biosynthesis
VIGDSSSPEFSVIIPLYNKEKSIGSTIESVLNQNYSNFELIIVNDGSTDNSIKIVQSFLDTRIKIFNKANGGVSSARNYGIEKSQCQFVIFLDADDLWFPDCLEEFANLIRDFPKADVFCTNYNMSGKNLVGSDRRYYINDYYHSSAFFLAKWSVPLMITGCVLIHKNCLKKVGYFNTKITHGEDIDIWERLGQNCRLAKSEKITTIYRTETENRASLLDECLKLKFDPLGPAKNRKLSKSQQLYFGVQFILNLGSFHFRRTDFNIFGDILRYPLWAIRGSIFILKARVFGYHFDS